MHAGKEKEEEKKTRHTRLNLFQLSSRIALVFQSVCSRTITDRLYYDWVAEYIWTGNKYVEEKEKYVCVCVYFH